jgi:23S rRNA pseudouridine1911/1915/1917 synthase
MKEQPLILQNLTDQDIRLDKFLADNLTDISRTYIQKIISQGGVLVDGFPIYKKAELVTPNTEVEVILPAPQESSLEPEEIPLDIVFENQDLIVVNKPPGMVVHPGLGHQKGTLVQAVLAHAPEIEGVGGVKRPGLVHRLDQDTSGLIILAKNDHAHQFLQDQFRSRVVDKVYLTLVEGIPPSPQGRVEVAIGRDPKYRQRMAAVLDRHGKEAISEYFTLERFQENTFLKVIILTGRTHQIRIHLAFLGCPVVGDSIYGKRKTFLPLTRQFLHAHQLSIIIPGEKVKRTFDAPLAPDLENVLSILRKRN